MFPGCSCGEDNEEDGGGASLADLSMFSVSPMRTTEVNIDAIDEDSRRLARNDAHVQPASYAGVLNELVWKANGVVAAEVWLEGKYGLLERPRDGYARKMPYQHPEGSVAEESMFKFGEPSLQHHAQHHVHRCMHRTISQHQVGQYHPSPLHHLPPTTRHKRTLYKFSDCMLVLGWQAAFGIEPAIIHTSKTCRVLYE